MKIILGIFLIVFSATAFLKPDMKIPSTKKNLVAGGSVSGFLAGLIGTGGALRASFLTGLKIDKFTYITTAASIALVTDATRIPVYVSQGFLLEQILLVHSDIDGNCCVRVLHRKENCKQNQ
jgi:hypothetical protein